MNSYQSEPIPFNQDIACRSLELALCKYRELGVTIGPGSRLQKALSILSKQGLSGRQEPRELQFIRAAYMTAFHHLLIPFSLPKDMSDDLRGLVARSLRGADLDSDERDTRPRDAEFHVVIASYLSLAGVPIDVSEKVSGKPDMAFHFDGRSIAVEAKRISGDGANTLLENGHEAAGQITSKHLMGLVALDCSKLAPTRALALDPGPFTAHLPALEKLDQRLSEQPGVFGRIAYALEADWEDATHGRILMRQGVHVILWANGEDGEGLRNTFHRMFLGISQRRNEVGDTLREFLSSGRP